MLELGQVLFPAHFSCPQERLDPLSKQEQSMPVVCEPKKGKWFDLYRSGSHAYHSWYTNHKEWQRFNNILIYACTYNIPAHLQSIDIPLFWWVEAEVPNKKFLTSYFALCKPLWIPTNPAHHKDILTILINKYDDKRETNPMFHSTLLSRNPWQEYLLCALLSKDWIKTWHVQYMD